MEIKNVSVKEIIHYDKNTKKHPDEQIIKIAASIKEFGFNVPVLLDKNNMIIAGHGRLYAANKLGLNEVPCIFLNDLTPNQIKAYRIADNKTAESDWDEALLIEEINDLMNDDYDISLTGFSKEELAGLYPDEDVQEVEAEDPNKVETTIKRGDIITLGEHRLVCGDATSKEDVHKLMDGKKADMVFTDPPYGINAVSKSGVLSKTYKNDILGDDDNNAATDAFNLVSKMNIENHIWWGANYYSECLPNSECWIVWDKNNGESDQTDCELAWTNFRSVNRQYTQASEKTNRTHPTQKPVSLIVWCFNKFKLNSVNLIIDLFGGSGSTLIACEQLKRKCYMMELDPQYCEVIARRWEKLTGKVRNE